MTGNESRILILERKLVDATAAIAALAQRMNRAEARMAALAGGGGGGGSGAGNYYAQPGSTIAAGTGTWPTITATSGLGDIYIADSGGLTLYQSGVAIQNYMPDAAMDTKRWLVWPNSDGTWDIRGESCTNG